MSKKLVEVSFSLGYLLVTFLVSLVKISLQKLYEAQYKAKALVQRLHELNTEDPVPVQHDIAPDVNSVAALAQHNIVQIQKRLKKECKTLFVADAKILTNRSPVVSQPMTEQKWFEAGYEAIVQCKMRFTRRECQKECQRECQKECQVSCAKNIRERLEKSKSQYRF